MEETKNGNRCRKNTKEHKMRKKMFVVKDTKGEACLSPFIANTSGEAERVFREGYKNQESLISQYPEDYDLYLIGDFDTATGQVVGLDTPHHVMKATQFISMNQ